MFDRDDGERDVYFVVSGAVRIVNFSGSGREIAYARVRAGGYFGELAALDGSNRSAAVVIAEESVLAGIPPATFLQLVRNYPEIRLRVMRRLAGIVRVCDDRILDLSTLRAERRVCAELVRLARQQTPDGQAWVIQQMRTQNEIASRASTTRETFGRVLGRLAGSGVVQRRSDGLYVRDIAQLQSLARDSMTQFEAEFAR
ncbi:MAG: Crp/Fnr family transcriptional regulator [Alphaproteobacteria bacterium]|nr:Crp/Fnr family transcriptional regulator [Alphaproteobacteria bacterium]